jgi:ethanolamine utilization protein EutN
MRIGRVVGSVTLNRIHPSLVGVQWKLAVPLMLDELNADADSEAAPGVSEELVVYDELGVGLGETIAISEGREAAMPFYPEVKPVDAYAAAILDNITVTKKI